MISDAFCLKVVLEQPSSSLHVLDAFTRLSVNVAADNTPVYPSMVGTYACTSQACNNFDGFEYDHGDNTGGCNIIWCLNCILLHQSQDGDLEVHLDTEVCEVRFLKISCNYLSF